MLLAFIRFLRVLLFLYVVVAVLAWTHQSIDPTSTRLNAFTSRLTEMNREGLLLLKSLVSSTITKAMTAASPVEVVKTPMTTSNTEKTDNSARYGGTLRSSY